MQGEGGREGGREGGGRIRRKNLSRSEIPDGSPEISPMGFSSASERIRDPDSHSGRRISVWIPGDPSL